MKKFMIVMIVLAAFGLTMTGCTERGDRLTEEQAVVVAKTLNSITSEVTSKATTDLAPSRATETTSYSFGNQATLEASDILYNYTISATCSLVGFAFSVDSIMSFDDYTFDAMIDIDDDNILETVTITLLGNYRLFFESKVNLAEVSIAFEMGEYDYNNINGLQMTLSGPDIEETLGVETLTRWINFSVKFKAGSNILAGATVTASGSINGQKITDEQINTFDYSAFSALDPSKK